MAGDDDDDDELDAIWNPAKGKKRTQPHKPLELVVANGKQSYQAFLAKDRVESFVVRCISGFRYRFFYHRLNATAIHDPNSDSLTIMTSDGVIQLYGRYLDAIDEALALKTCATIFEYSAELFLPPSDATAPFIEQIVVLFPPPPKPAEPAKKERGEEKPEKQEA